MPEKDYEKRLKVGEEIQIGPSPLPPSPEFPEGEWDTFVEPGGSTVKRMTRLPYKTGPEVTPTPIMPLPRAPTMLPPREDIPKVQPILSGRLIIESRTDDTSQVIEEIRQAGGTVETSYRNLIQVTLSEEAYTNLRESPNIKIIRKPWTPLPALSTTKRPTAPDVSYPSEKPIFTPAPRYGFPEPATSTPTKKPVTPTTPQIRLEPPRLQVVSTPMTRVTNQKVLIEAMLNTWFELSSESYNEAHEMFGDDSQSMLEWLRDTNPELYRNIYMNAQKTI